MHAFLSNLAEMEKSGVNPVPGSRSASKVDQFVYVPTPVDMQHFFQIHARVSE